MRINVFKEGGNDGQGSFITAGGELTGPLLLTGEHSQPLHAVPKQYADNLAYNISADQILTDTLPIGRLPGLTGDLSTVQGTNTIILSNTGVTPGSLTKPSVDSKGRVTAGNVITASDIDSISFNKLTNTPNTLAGYGITNAAVKENGNITGELNLNHEPVDLDDIATKGYVDTVAITAGGLSSGDIVRKTTDITPDGFFKCNGGLVNKTTYAGLYNIIGTKFNTNHQLDGGQPWVYQGGFNDQQQDNIDNWTSTTVGPISAYGSTTVVTNNYVYIIGGTTASTVFLSTVYMAPINADGTLGAWTAGTAMPAARAFHGSFVYKNRLFVIGGTYYTTTYVQVNTIYSCQINDNGTLGAWVTETAFPIAISAMTPVVIKNKVYIIGGYGASSTLSTIYCATISDSGVLGSWVLTGSLPSVMSHYSLAITKNHLHLIAGVNGTSYTATYTTTIDSDGALGTWINGLPLPTVIHRASVCVTKNRVYIIGGSSNIGFLTSACFSTVYHAEINADGTLGTWQLGSSFGVACVPNSVFIVKDKIYILGGLRASSVFTNAGYVANFTGGKNDYSEYYYVDDSIIDIYETYFTLPDYTKSDQKLHKSIVSYIKY